ncbi:FKBP-type peptidyl-prolyl cis-trans isomerase [Duganella sp. BuS-21]|uniref:FKBP-type peptidyl-prolyl cis-trans isomerase n=1 Tax=Duganella sp. BuS-21 TaxID=2943848 RepID=UPI0035A74554
MKLKSSLWLYGASAADHQGVKINTNLSSATPHVFVLGSDTVLKGLNQGVSGMKMGGQRTLILPARLAYGTTGSGAIPANSGMVFTIELISVQ